MKKINGFETAQAYTGEFEKIRLGGHVCKITEVEDRESFLLLRYDIVKGENKDYFKRKFENDTRDQKKWGGVHSVFYNEYQSQDCSRVFKGLITSIEKSNEGFKWEWDEAKLVGKVFGGVFGEEEYEAGKFATKLKFIRSVEGIENAEIPKRKTISKSDDGFYPINEDDLNGLPF